MSADSFMPLPDYIQLTPEEMLPRAVAMRVELQKRRSVRTFSNRPVARAVIEECLLAAGSAPSGANLQPWYFVVVSDPEVKRRIRDGAEQEEREFYRHRATAQWLADLAPLGTDENKPFLEAAPYLIVIFAQHQRIFPDGSKVPNYYVSESVGIAAGLLIAALHCSGLATLTHTPSPMGFLNRILTRPANEKPYLVLITGFPADDTRVPRLAKKTLLELATFV
jgi:iodotyrosine deiodinase